MPNCLEFQDFGMALPQGDSTKILFSGANLILPQHGFYLLVGTSGGGKSSLLRLLAGLLPDREPGPEISGKMFLFGHRVDLGARPVAAGAIIAILQDEGLLDELSPSANVALALRAAGRSRRLTAGLLALAGLPEPPERVADLSGGMRKRIAVARALATDPMLLLADEPTAGLDATSARGIAQVLRAAHDAAKDRTTIVITHDEDAFAGLHDGVLVIDGKRQRLELTKDGRIAESDMVASGPSAVSRGSTSTGLQRLLLSLASFAETLWDAIRRLPPVELWQTSRAVLHACLVPLLFVGLCCAVIGGLATFFALRNNPIQGGFESALLVGTGKVLIAILSPLLSGFFLVVRLVAGATARIGTMQRTNQIAALRMMGISPQDWLLTPLVLALMVGMPVASIVGCAAAAVASLGATMLVSGTSAVGWALAYFAAVRGADILLILGKSAMSGFLVGVVCYHLGTGPKRSGADVGNAVDHAIVAGTIIVLGVHAGWTLWAYS